MAVFVKAVLDARPAQFDSTALDVAWRPITSTRSKLRIGFLGEDPIFPLHPTVKTALAEVVDLLKKDGHELIALTPHEALVGPSYDVALQIFGLDKSSASTVLKGGEPFIPSIISGRNAMREVKFDRSFLPDTRDIPDGLDRLALLNVKRAEIQETWRKVWTEHQLDAVIGPGAQNTAVEHDQYGPAPYTALLNFLDVCGALNL